MGKIFKAFKSVFTGSQKKDVQPITASDKKRPPSIGGGGVPGNYGTTGSLLGSSIAGVTDDAKTSRTLLGG